MSEPPPEARLSKMGEAVGSVKHARITAIWAMVVMAICIVGPLFLIALAR